MNRIVLSVIALTLFLNSFVYGQSSHELLSQDDLKFLAEMTRDVVNASRIQPGQKISPDFGGNNTGGILIRPGGRDCYPAFWIRDYAMSLESGFITASEQQHMLMLTASKQCDQTWITDAGSMVPQGAIADHIRIDDSNPVYFPGSYDYKGQGGRKWGMFPPYCDNFFFIHMAWWYIKETGTTDILKSVINGRKMTERLEMAFRVPPTRLEGVLVTTTDDFRGIDFGFRDVITMTGDLCLPSVLKYRAALEMAEIAEVLRNSDGSDAYRNIAERLKREIPEKFSEGRGMLRSSTGTSRQPDVWSTVLAIKFGLLSNKQMEMASHFLAESYKNGNLADRGNIRHVLKCDDFSEQTSWEKSLVKKNLYQNGAYWGTATGWVCEAIARVDFPAAQKLAREFVDDLREGDFRKGPGFGAPWECYNAEAPQNAVYMTTVTCPYIVFAK